MCAEIEQPDEYVNCMDQSIVTKMNYIWKKFAVTLIFGTSNTFQKNHLQNWDCVSLS